MVDLIIQDLKHLDGTCFMTAPMPLVELFLLFMRETPSLILNELKVALLGLHLYILGRRAIVLQGWRLKFLSNRGLSFLHLDYLDRLFAC
jgi:hypothetical protein